MKVYVYQLPDGEFRYFNKKLCEGVRLEGWKFLGTLDLDIQPEKKTVVKEAEYKGVLLSDGFNKQLDIYSTLPVDAKNIRITYEVEE